MADVTISPAAAAQLATRAGKVLYTLTIEQGQCAKRQPNGKIEFVQSDVVVLRGARGAEYRSICNVHDGLHRFIERPAKGYVFALVDGCVYLAHEVRRAA